ALQEHRVLARDGHVVEEDLAVGRAADRRALALWMKRLARASAARADDERRPLDPQVLERRGRFVVDLVGRVLLRRLGAALVLHEQRAALRAVVRGLRVLEAALRAVDVTHEGGAPFDVRMSVSDSTSTWSRTLLPPVSRRRATSSAR